MQTAEYSLLKYTVYNALFPLLSAESKKDLLG